MSRGWYGGWPKYIPVAKRKQQAAKEITKLKKKGKEINPVVLTGRIIANTFWGKAWCNNLESYSDFENRLPRGRTYVRNGSVLDLAITKGEISALVNGSSLYKVNITISPLAASKWQDIIKECAGKIDSLIELLRGKFSKSVMDIITRQNTGLFPHPKEIELSCSCPDYADMCKHIAAALYGVGARLDESPEQLFILRHVDHGELISATETVHKLTQPKLKPDKKTIKDADLSSLFGIDMDEKPVAAKKSMPKKEKNLRPSASKSKRKVKLPKVGATGR